MTQLASVTAWIATPPAAVWAVLVDFGHPHRLVPSILRCDIVGEGVGAVRTVHSARGLLIDERLVDCDEARLRLSYDVLESRDMPFAGVDSYLATVTLAAERGGTTVRWESKGKLTGPAEPVRRFLEEHYRGAIARIAAGAA